jgi:hypothetical protein
MLNKITVLKAVRGSFLKAAENFLRELLRAVPFF